MTTYDEDLSAWATAETGLAETTFPVSCPFAAEEVLAPSFAPDE